MHFYSGRSSSGGGRGSSSARTTETGRRYLRWYAEGKTHRSPMRYWWPTVVRREPCQLPADANYAVVLRMHIPVSLDARAPSLLGQARTKNNVDSSRKVSNIQPLHPHSFSSPVQQTGGSSIHEAVRKRGCGTCLNGLTFGGPCMHAWGVHAWGVHAWGMHEGSWGAGQGRARKGLWKDEKGGGIYMLWFASLPAGHRFGLWRTFV